MNTFIPFHLLCDVFPRQGISWVKSWVNNCSMIADKSWNLSFPSRKSLLSIIPIKVEIDFTGSEGLSKGSHNNKLWERWNVSLWNTMLDTDQYKFVYLWYPLCTTCLCFSIFRFKINKNLSCILVYIYIACVNKLSYDPHETMDQCFIVFHKLMKNIFFHSTLFNIGKFVLSNEGRKKTRLGRSEAHSLASIS